MGQESARVLRRQGNLAVIELSGRAFPAIALQGDTFHAVVVQAEEIAAALAGADPEVVEEMGDLVARLRAVRAFYEEVLAEEGVRVPYGREGGG